MVGPPAHIALNALTENIGHIDDSEMHDMVTAISGAGISPAIRVAGDDPKSIKRALDTGTQYVCPRDSVMEALTS